MNANAPILDPVFLKNQRDRLTQLREELSHSTQTEQSEETGVRSQSLGEAQESEDDAQKLTLLEIDGSLVARNLRRLAQVDRALQKLSDGTYGLSDASGATIARERLEAVPEAIYTLQEMQALESG
jgi:DnaK suppressor protein